MRRMISALVVAANLAWPMFGGAAPPATELAGPPRAELPGKPTGPIVVEHRLATPPAVGIPLDVGITARVAGDVGRLGIEANATAPEAALVTAPVLVAVGEGTYSWRLTVVPLVAEAGYLSVIVSGSIEGEAQARSITISLRSAAAEGDPPALAVAGGETLIALPVQESP